MDTTDLKILRLLQKNARLTYKEIADQINLSQTPVFDRIKRLESEGVIERYVTLLNKKKVGGGLTVYSQVTLKNQTENLSTKFNTAVQSLPEVVECNFVSGSFDYLLKIVVPDMETYHAFHQKKLSGIEGVTQINSYFVMSEVKNTTEIPI